MSSYIIAGSADSTDTAYCEEIARRIKAKYKNIDFRFVIKHPSEWEEYLQQICRIYGFPKKSNPIIYTFDGKIIGNKQSFMATTSKYFGLDEQLLVVENLSNQINMKIATEQLRKKNIQKNNIKTSVQKIQSQYQNLLKKNILKYQLKQKKQYLIHGIQYIHRQVKGLCPNMAFAKNKELNVHVDEIVPQNIDLMAISLNDQIKIDEPVVHQVVTAGKQAFVTSNQKNASEHDRMSEASRTNKMHQSIVSYDKDSKNMKQSSKSKSKLRIDEENDDVPDYIDYDIGQLKVADLSDDFHVAFQKNSHISGQMIFYFDEQNKGQKIRMHNNNRPVKGHRVLIKEIHYDGLDNNLDLSIKQQQAHNQKIQSQQKIQNEPFPQKSEQPSQQVLKEEGAKEVSQNPFENEKYKTQPNIPECQQKDSLKNIQNYADDVLSQAHSQSLNLISHLNYHTLYIQKPLSNLELKNLIFWIKQTNSIGCLRFLSQNPNPRVKLYHRKYLLNTKNEDKISLMLPIQKFIQKQIEDNQIEKIEVPSQRCLDYEVILNQQKFQLITIKDIGFEHYIYPLKNDSSQQTLAKIIKHTIDHVLALQEQLKRDIGYNLIFTKDMLMIVPLSEPYKIYNGQKLYFDGLAYLGFVHTADVIESYQIKQPSNKKNQGLKIRQMLCKCSNSQNLEQ